ncbi:class I SAM-dependent DNA methyltransferase [Cytobacillus horneckiae]|uniref:class I SAM-dependent DNA methyltransferase n=1 Tax=Cytobacillus horneckiae TaxID=549687 RepID=UPI003D9A3C94
MSYQQFAYLYDELMKDAPYDEWVKFLAKQTEKHHLQGNRLLDLACGTGELSVRLAQAGYDVVGVDLSEDMLAVAQGKAASQQVSIQFFQQNMAELDGLGKYDLICILCDSLNYLETEEEVAATFHAVYNHLSDGGLFVFDVHSLYKMAYLFIDQTYVLNDEEISYIWQSFAGEHEHSAEHELSFFVLDEESGRYDRYDELHYQRTFSPEVYQTWLNECGFTILQVSADFHDGPIEENPERIFFVCAKN